MNLRHPKFHLDTLEAVLYQANQTQQNTTQLTSQLQVATTQVSAITKSQQTTQEATIAIQLACEKVLQENIQLGQHCLQQGQLISKHLAREIIQKQVIDNLLYERKTQAAIIAKLEEEKRLQEQTIAELKAENAAKAKEIQELKAAVISVNARQVHLKRKEAASPFETQEGSNRSAAGFFMAAVNSTPSARPRMLSPSNSSLFFHQVPLSSYGNSFELTLLPTATPVPKQSFAEAASFNL